MPGLTELLLRMLLAAALGAALGLERELSGQRAGLRTHLLVALGACVFTEAGFAYGPRPGLDPTRVAAQVVTGIGFLGAGAILRYGATVRGLTTAASLWVVAAIGLAAGIGLYAESAVAAGLTLVALVGLRPLRTRLRLRRRTDRVELIVETEATVDLGALVRPLSDAGVRLENLRIDEREDEDGLHVRLVVNLAGASRSRDELLASVAAVDGVREVEWQG